MRNQQREIEIEREKIHMNKVIEQAKKEEIDDWIKGREKIQRYGEDLIDQMSYNQRQKEIVSCYKDYALFAVKLYVTLLVYIFFRWRRISRLSLTTI